MKYNEWAAHKSESSKKTQLRKDINQTIRIVSTYSEFLTFMEAKGYEIKNAEFGENSRKYITFRSPDMSRPVRGSAKSLGKNFRSSRRRLLPPTSHTTGHAVPHPAVQLT